MANPNYWITDPSNGKFAQYPWKFSSFYFLKQPGGPFVRIRLELRRSDRGPVIVYYPTRLVWFVNSMTFDELISNSKYFKGGNLWLNSETAGFLDRKATYNLQSNSPGFPNLVGLRPVDSKGFNQELHRGSIVSGAGNWPIGFKITQMITIAENALKIYEHFPIRGIIPLGEADVDTKELTLELLKVLSYKSPPNRMDIIQDDDHAAEKSPLVASLKE